jgi:uncharacterized delta-60 repeat protein
MAINNFSIRDSSTLNAGKPLMFLNQSRVNTHRRIVMKIAMRLLSVVLLSLSFNVQLVAAPASVSGVFAAGAIDTAFATNGLFKFNNTQMTFTSASAVQSNNKIVSVGFCNTYPGDACVSRLQPNGNAIDTTFGVSGFRTIDFGGQERPSTIAVDAYDSVLVGGYCQQLIAGWSGCMVRLSPNGAIDTSFGSGGRLSPVGMIAVTGIAFVPDPDEPGAQRIVAIGECYNAGSQFCVARFLGNGAPDLSFNSGSVLRFATGMTESIPISMTIDGGGNVLFTGRCYNAGANYVYNFCVARVTPAGALDTAFNGSGIKLWSPVNEGGDESASIALTSTGRIVVGGNCSRAGVAKFCASALLGNGALDTSFGVGEFAGLGTQLTSMSSGVSALSMHIDGDGKILLTGTCGDSQHCFARLRSNGAPDVSFGSFGELQFNLNTPQTPVSPSFASSAIVVKGNRLIVSGALNASNSNDRGYIARYDLNPPPGERCNLDLDEDGYLSPEVDGAMWTRILLGFRGNAVIAGLPQARGFPGRTTWEQIRTHLFNQCGIR